MAKAKSPGRDGWPIELFQHFFEFTGFELVKMAGTVKTDRNILGAINSTFLTLNAKKSKSFFSCEYK